MKYEEAKEIVRKQQNKKENYKTPLNRDRNHKKVRLLQDRLSIRMET